MSMSDSVEIYMLCSFLIFFFYAIGLYVFFQGTQNNMYRNITINCTE